MPLFAIVLSAQQQLSISQTRRQLTIQRSRANSSQNGSDNLQTTIGNCFYLPANEPGNAIFQTNPTRHIYRLITKDDQSRTETANTVHRKIRSILFFNNRENANKAALEMHRLPSARPTLTSVCLVVFNRFFLIVSDYSHADDEIRRMFTPYDRKRSLNGINR